MAATLAWLSTDMAELITYEPAGARPTQTRRAERTAGTLEPAPFISELRVRVDRLEGAFAGTPDQRPETPNSGTLLCLIIVGVFRDLHRSRLRFAPESAVIEGRCSATFLRHRFKLAPSDQGKRPALAYYNRYDFAEVDTRRASSDQPNLEGSSIARRSARPRPDKVKREFLQKVLFRSGAQATIPRRASKKPAFSWELRRRTMLIDVDRPDALQTMLKPSDYHHAG
jgi:hypothetical protein